MKHERITVTPDVMMGKPCIKGTRITVEQILRELGVMTPADVLDAHPRLTADDINAALAYAADVVRGVWLTTQPTLLGETADAFSG